MADFSDRLGSFLLTTAGNALVVVIVAAIAWVAYRVLARVVRSFAARAATAPAPGDGELGAEQQAIRRAERSRRLDTVAGFGLRLVRWFTIAVIASVVVAVFLPSAWSAIGGLGVGFGVAIGGAIGFGTQQLVRDYLNGVLILGENPYSVGDIVAIAGVRGTVEEVGLRRTVIRDMDGTVHSVPNGEIAVASNFTRRFARVNERFIVAYGTDIAHVTTVINAIGEAFAADADWAPEAHRHARRPASRPGRRSRDPGARLVRVRPGDQWAVAGEFRRRVLDAFMREGIRLATAQRLQVDGPLPLPVADADGAESGAEYT